jgi:tetratricopeptide (TPR) repeat protein
MVACQGDVLVPHLAVLPSQSSRPQALFTLDLDWYFSSIAVLSRRRALRRGLSFPVEIFPRQFLTAALLFASTVTAAAQGVDTADESRAISRQVSALIKARSFNEAEALANKGLALCENAVGVRGFCLGQFNDSLGDIAYSTAQYSNALIFFQKAVEAREGLLNNESALALASQVRLGSTYLALHRLDDAEPFLKNAVAGLARTAPLSSNLKTALEALTQL